MEANAETLNDGVVFDGEFGDHVTRSDYSGHDLVASKEFSRRARKEEKIKHFFSLLFDRGFLLQ